MCAIMGGSKHTQSTAHFPEQDTVYGHLAYYPQSLAHFANEEEDGGPNQDVRTENEESESPVPHRS